MNLPELNFEISNVDQTNFKEKIGLEIKSLIEIPTIGFNEETKRFGILFPNHLLDYYFK